MGRNIWLYKLIFSPEVEEKKCIPPNYLEKVLLITRIWRKSVYRVGNWVHYSYQNVGVLHTPCQTLGFSTVSKEQPLFKLFTRQNPVFQPILTVTIVTVNIGWNTGFSLINNLYKGCSLLTMLKTNVWRGKKLKDTILTYIPKIHTVKKKT